MIEPAMGIHRTTLKTSTPITAASMIRPRCSFLPMISPPINVPTAAYPNRSTTITNSHQGKSANIPTKVTMRRIVTSGTTMISPSAPQPSDENRWRRVRMVRRSPERTGRRSSHPSSHPSSHRPRASLLGEPYLQLDLVPDRDTVLADERDRRLEAAGRLTEVTMHRDELETAALVEAERIQIVVGGDEPQAGTAGAGGRVPDRCHQRRSDARVQREGFEQHQLALAVHHLVDGQARRNVVLVDSAEAG